MLDRREMRSALATAYSRPRSVCLKSNNRGAPDSNGAKNSDGVVKTSRAPGRPCAFQLAIGEKQFRLSRSGESKYAGVMSAEVTAFLKSSSACCSSGVVSLFTGIPPSVLKNANTGLPSFCASWNSPPVYVSSGRFWNQGPSFEPDDQNHRIRQLHLLKANLQRFRWLRNE